MDIIVGKPVVYMGVVYWVQTSSKNYHETFRRLDLKRCHPREDDPSLRDIDERLTTPWDGTVNQNLQNK